MSLAIDLLREMLVAGESPVYILYMLARQFRLILAVKSLKANVYLINSTVKLSLHPYVLKKYSSRQKL